MSDRLRQARARALRALVPPANLPLAGWLEETVKLPASVASVQGPLRLWPFQRGIADAISDPDIERLWLVKPTRVGFTTLLTGTIASYVANDPCPIGVYQPTEDDCRDYMVSDIEPVFEASPKLHGKLSGAEDENGRNTLMQRRFAGGSLKLLAAKAERNFRRHNFRVLLMDEIDGMTPTKEGPPIDLAEKRTTSFRDRKIILG
ncbi:MAG: phage terminase large subunit family protein, partial [Pseudomonadota bacterium]